MISAATNMMLSAMQASMGFWGTCTNPRAAAASVRLWATVNAVTVRRTRRHPFYQQEQGKHEQQVIDAAEDVLDAKAKIGGSHVEARRLCRNR